MDKRTSDLGRRVANLQAFQAAVEYDKQIKTAQELTTRLQSNASAYTNLVMVAGYAGFFTFWATLSDKLPPWLYAVTGLLIIVSLLLFIGWEITKMIWSALHLNKVQRNLEGKPGPEVLAQFQSSLQQFEKASNQVWVWFLVPTVVCGLSAGFCVLGFFVWRIAQRFI
ncbi:hypothetical protein ASD68_12680 [Rhodanobacter sp. Root627]|nr:hypothetical protein ASD68_12680 [Rhodanobacter sp. Root627]